MASGIGPYLVGSLVWGVGLSLGGKTGYILIRHAILACDDVTPFCRCRKGGSDWGYAAIRLSGRWSVARWPDWL
jgi:glycerol uptake facilitator protein